MPRLQDLVTVGSGLPALQPIQNAMDVSAYKRVVLQVRKPDPRRKGLGNWGPGAAAAAKPAAADAEGR